MNDEQITPPAIADVGAHLAVQAELAERALHDLVARYVAAPATAWLSFGEGEPAEQTLPGAPRDPFHGFAILNGSTKTIRWGLASGSGVGSAFTCPPLTAIVMPAQFSELSLSVSQSDALGPVERVGVVRLQAPPPAPAVYQYGAALELLNALTGNAEAQRTPSVVTSFPIAGLAVGVGETVVWTPKAGKRFRLLGFMLETEATRVLEVLDGAGGPRIFSIPLTGGITYPTPANFGNGILSSKPGNPLVLAATLAGQLQGSIFGTEE